jgi:nucleoside-diphosphate-sugar epimerase
MLTVVLGADGFIGRHLVAMWRERGWPVHPIGRAAGHFTDPAVVGSALAGSPKAERILHAITKQRTGPIQYSIQDELLRDNTLIHLNVLEAWRRHQPQAKLISLGSSCIYPVSDRPLPESTFRTGAPHPSVRGYALAKEVLVTGSETYGSRYALNWLHCVLATLYGPFAHTEPDSSHFMGALIARAVAGRSEGAREFQVWGNPDMVRDLLYVTDQIDAVIAADGAFTNRIINCTSNTPLTIGGCALSIQHALGWDAQIKYPQGTFQGTSYKCLDRGCSWKQPAGRRKPTSQPEYAVPSTPASGEPLQYNDHMPDAVASKFLWRRHRLSRIFWAGAGCRPRHGD